MTAAFRKVISVAASLALAALFARAATAAQTPSVDRAAAEDCFLRAYNHFINNRIWNSLDELNESLAQNVYFVDAYYMRALAYRRLGMYPQAEAEITSYLEVRREDPRANVILDIMREEWAAIRRRAAAQDAQADCFFTSDTIHSLLGLPVPSARAFRGMQGLGKISCSGSVVLLCDTYGDRLWAFDRNNKGAAAELAVERPAVCSMIGPSRGVIFGKNGDVRSVVFNFDRMTAEEAEIGRIEANVADAVFVDSALVAAADRTGQAVRFYSFPELKQLSAWSPADSDSSGKLFEPVAVAGYGPFLAVADRSNERVCVIDAYTLNERERVDIPSPRDICWGPDGELYVLSENGTIYSRSVLKAVSADPAPVTEGLKDAWSMAWTDRGPIVCDITARIWWSSRINPGYRDISGTMALSSPWLEDKGGTETLMVKAVASSFFQEFIQDKLPVTQVIWRGEQRPSSASSAPSSSLSQSRFYASSSAGLSSEAPIVTIKKVSDIFADIAKLSRRGEEIPRVIVLDTAVSGSQEELALLLSFLMHQGVRLDLWAVTRPPSAALSHISRITLGSVYYARTLSMVPPNSRAEWTLKIPLPPDTYTFGYPSESTLSVYADIDSIRFTDWLPVWPSLLEKKIAEDDEQ